MAYFNDQSEACNSNYTTFDNDFNQSAAGYPREFRPSMSGHGDNNVDISSSTLEPTAQEFHPNNGGNNQNGGAVRKRPQYGRSQQRDYGQNRGKIGSGRRFKNTKQQQQQESSDFEEHANTVDGAGMSTSSSRSIRSQSFDNNYHHYDKYGSNKYDSKSKSNNYNKPDRDRFYNNYNDKHGRQINKYNSKTYYDRSNRDNFRSNNFFDNPGNGRIGQNDYKSSQNDYRSAENDHRSCQNDYRSPQSDYRSPQSDYRSPQSDYRSAENDYRSPQNDYYRNSYGSKNTRSFKSKSYEDKNETSRSSRDWRSKTGSDNKEKSKRVESKKKMAASHRERLEEMIKCRLLECLVCCEKIKNIDKVWSCVLCYHIFHLSCVTVWAESSKIENGWRCPACQNVYSDVPKQYKCYCGKTVEPKYDAGTVPHGCGEMCLRKGRACDHKCSLLCHPGPCPECTVMVSKACGCGATNQVVKCSADVEIVCENVCDKLLECGVHRCKQVCHSGECELCTEVIRQECFCGKVGRKVACRGEYSGMTKYECGEVCGKVLSCGNHSCKKSCHDGPCDTCDRDVDKIVTCPCGKTPLDKPRLSCLDPIPCCDKMCRKVLKCGQPSAPHVCKERCHEGACPPCHLTTTVRCRCGHMDKEIQCDKLTTKADDARCEKKCTKKRLCGKHRCNQRCCIEIEHVCPLPCNRLLSCGQHRCERTCHSGRCPPCMETSFEELYCECGASVIFPPVPCGTKPPSCDKPCPRPISCGHPVNHNCHTGPCPPCTVLCKRWCYGGHEQRSAIFCYQENFSCGLPCGKDMSCGRHKCNKPCHEGACPTTCKQPCTVPRALCGHPCGRPCHDPPCPESSCKHMVNVTCACGVQKGVRSCLEVADEFKNIQMAQMKEKMGALSKEQTVDISDIVNNVPKRPSVLKILECTEECRVLERNRRLAIGLQIVNPDISQKLTPRYSDFMRQWAKKDPGFCQRVHDRLAELVQLAKQSKQKSRSYSFESMNREKRHFVHEYCEHFGVDSEAYDAEPNRNVVATAIKDKSWLPSMSLLEVIQRENGQRKVPGPVSMGKSTLGKSETVSLKLPCRIQRANTPPTELVDYFDGAP